MSDLIFSVDLVTPLLIIIAIGYLFQRFRIVNDEFVRGCSKLAFGVCMPCVVFQNLREADLTGLTDMTPIVFLLTALVVITVLAIVVLPRMIEDRAIAASLAQATIRVNVTAQGYAILTNMYAAQDAVMGNLMLTLTLVVTNFLAPIIFIVMIRDEKHDSIRMVRQAVRAVITNPILIGAALGLLCSLLKLPLPTGAAGAVRQLGQVAVPLCLFMMGTAIRFDVVKRHLRYTLPVLAFASVIKPFVWVCLGAMAGFRGDVLVALLLCAGCAQPSNSFVLAKEMGGNEQISSELVCMSILVSSVALVVGVFLLRWFGLT